MEDPEKKILEWCGHLAVPRLVDEKSQSACRACASKFGGILSKTKSHHCRLCGYLYCSACTAKYHVPLIFRIKNKDGPARVCMSCVEGCMAEKAAAERGEQSGTAGAGGGLGGGMGVGGSALSANSLSASLRSMAQQVEIAPPDSWEEEAAFVQCPKCSAKKCKTHNCRVCGKLFCDKCTSKMDIPSYFERKKGKTGPARVCDSCRYRIVSGGAKLVQQLSPAAALAQGVSLKKAAGPPPPPPGFLGKDRRASRFAGKCSAPGCLAPATSADGKCATHGGGRDPGAPTLLVVKREGEDEVLASITVPPTLASPSPALASEVEPEQPTLAWIDAQFRKLCPQEQATGFQYVLRGQPVPAAFYTVLLAKSLGSTLLIRPKQRHQLDGLSDSLLGALPPVSEDGEGAVSAHNNPFKRDDAAEQRRAQEKAEKERLAQLKKEKRKAEFKRPVLLAKHKSFASPRLVVASASSPALGPSGGAKAPPPLPGGSKAPPPPPPAGEDVFRARAKRIFGQL